jgi:hypothetical protein
MLLTEALSGITLCISSVNFVFSVDKEKLKEIPNKLWSSHIFFCVAGALFYSQTYELILLLWILTFFCILWDAHSSKTYAQVTLLSVDFIWLILKSKANFATITGITGGPVIGWLVVAGIFLLIISPVLTGIKLFNDLSNRGFSALAMAALLSMDYSIGLICGSIIQPFFIKFMTSLAGNSSL